MTTPAEMAAGVIADPAWTFADDPSRAIAHASSRAASARMRMGAQYRWGTAAQAQLRAAFWTSVGLLLCEAAGREPGQVLANLKRELGL